MKIRIISIIGFLSCLTLTGLAQESKIEKCSVPKGKGGKYKVISELRLLGQPRKVVLDIVIKPKNFNKQYMLKFARRIKAVYCNEDIVHIAIFDSKKAQYGWGHDVITSKGEIDRRRGNYILDRKTNDEGLDFLTEAGNKQSQVNVEISKANQKVDR